jgi:hypothetical protein
MTDNERSELEHLPIAEVERRAAAGDADARAVLECLATHCAALAKGALEAMNSRYAAMAAAAAESMSSQFTAVAVRVRANFEKAFPVAAIGVPKGLADGMRKLDERDAQVSKRLSRLVDKIPGRPRRCRFFSHAPFTRRPQ